MATVSSFPIETVLAQDVSVSSIAGNTGAFTISNGITNSGNDIRLNVGQLPGTATNNSASAGNVGEFITAALAAGSATSLTTATAKTITSISLTAGDWDVHGIVGFAVASTTTVTQIIAAINTTTNALPASAGVEGYAFLNASFTTGPASNAMPTGTTRVSLSTTTTVYLVAQSSFGVSTMGAYGTISARRVR